MLILSQFHQHFSCVSIHTRHDAVTALLYSTLRISLRQSHRRRPRSLSLRVHQISQDLEIAHEHFGVLSDQSFATLYPFSDPPYGPDRRQTTDKRTHLTPLPRIDGEGESEGGDYAGSFSRMKNNLGNNPMRYARRHANHLIPSLFASNLGGGASSCSVRVDICLCTTSTSTSTSVNLLSF